jgi:hypothetical protein
MLEVVAGEEGTTAGAEVQDPPRLMASAALRTLEVRERHGVTGLYVRDGPVHLVPALAHIRKDPR